MIKAIFFDVDGTLVSHRIGAIPPSSRRALEKLREKGIRRVIATGRHMLELSMLHVSDLDFDAYITLNGQLCLDGEGNILFENPILGESREALLRLFREKTIPLALVERDRMYINYVNEKVERAQQAVSSPVPAVWEYSGGNIYLAMVYVGREEDGLMSTLLPGCTATRWSDYGLDVIASSGGKAQGIRQYLHAAGIRPEETMAFGDGDNDVEMLRLVKTGVAMGNAVPALKEAADYVTACVDEDGVEKALLALNILE